jgi:hypothetical protein
MEKISFQKHPSILLNELYRLKNYQGANPKDANILFVGRDPNWAIDVESKDYFKYINQYLKDGISFWKNHNIHHPFLLSDYKGNGKKYHKFFAKLNLDQSFSSKISFVELIGFPTTGMAKKNNKLFQEYLLSDENRKHLIELDKILLDKNKVVFIAWGLIEDFKYLNRKIGLFERLARIDKSIMNIEDLNHYENIYIQKHFSDSISNVTIEKMSKEILSIID